MYTEIAKAFGEPSQPHLRGQKLRLVREDFSEVRVLADAHRLPNGNRSLIQGCGLLVLLLSASTLVAAFYSWTSTTRYLELSRGARNSDSDSLGGFVSKTTRISTANGSTRLPTGHEMCKNASLRACDAQENPEENVHVTRQGRARHKGLEHRWNTASRPARTMSAQNGGKSCMHMPRVNRELQRFPIAATRPLINISVSRFPWDRLADLTCSLNNSAMWLRSSATLGCCDPYVFSSITRARSCKAPASS